VSSHFTKVQGYEPLNAPRIPTRKPKNNVRVKHLKLPKKNLQTSQTVEKYEH